jgi:hypothetical protein
MRSFMMLLTALMLASVVVSGCSTHKPGTPQKDVSAKKTENLLIPDAHNSKVILRMVGGAGMFKAGPPGDMKEVGKVYDDVGGNAVPPYLKGLFRHLNSVLDDLPERVILYPAGQPIEVSTLNEWERRERYSHALLNMGSCGPISRTFIGQPFKTYLVEFDMNNTTQRCSEKVFDISQEGQRDLISSSPDLDAWRLHR